MVALLLMVCLLSHLKVINEVMDDIPPLDQGCFLSPDKRDIQHWTNVHRLCKQIFTLYSIRTSAEHFCNGKYR